MLRGDFDVNRSLETSTVALYKARAPSCFIAHRTMERRGAAWRLSETSDRPLLF